MTLIKKKKIKPIYIYIYHDKNEVFIIGKLNKCMSFLFKKTI